MKISPNMTIGSVKGPQIKLQGGARGAFEDVLKGLEVGSAPALDKPGAPIQPMPLSPVKLGALSASEDAIGLLERYSQAVADPAQSVKSLENMVDELDAMRVKVSESASFISDDDPLKGIMNEVSSALYGEVLRFRRGDLIG